MGQFLLQRILQTIPVLIGVALISFILSELSGNAVRQSLGQHADVETIKQVEAYYGYDRPRHERFARYLWRLGHGDLGISVAKDRVPVSEMIVDGMLVTFKLALGGILFASALGVFLGILSAWRAGKLIDNIASIMAALGISFPAFFLGMLLLLVFAVRLQWFPIGGYVPGSLSHLALPCLTLGLISTASISRLTRNCMLEALSQDYVRTGRAKGIRQWPVMLGHALPNALVPVVTVIGNDFASLLIGAVLTETVFQIPGIGSVIGDAIFQRDLPVVMGCCLVFGFIFVTTNLVIDIVYALLDPRIRYAD